MKLSELRRRLRLIGLVCAVIAFALGMWLAQSWPFPLRLGVSAVFAIIGGWVGFLITPLGDKPIEND